MLTDALSRQYEKCLSMFVETIKNYDNELWHDATNYKSPAWQIAYHALYCTNAYCSPTAERIRRWPKERENYHRFSEMHKIRARDPSAILPYSQDDILEYLEFIRANVPGYLAEMQPEQDCWPDWYDESQLEFHLNNLRHTQHHIADLIERHDIKSEFSYEWR